MSQIWADKAIDDMKASYEAEIAALRTRIEELESAKWQQQHVDTMNDMASLRIALESAESKLAEARADALEEAKAAYTAGFNASAQGWNGEHGCDTDTDDGFIAIRDAYFRAIRDLKSGGANG